MSEKIGRNEPCHCGSGLKYKKCCLIKNIELEKEIKRSEKNQPDYNDPFKPDLKSEKIVVCLHCGEEFKEKEIKWDSTSGLWVCKNYPNCDGAGLGFDLHHKND